jgi:DnaD/phage-associated family protein
VTETPGFIGFADGRLKPVMVPEPFFTDLLPLIDDLAELKLTLHTFWLLNGQENELRYIRGDDLRGDELLLGSLNLDSELRSPHAALADALERAVARNTLLRVDVEILSRNGGPSLADDLYFLNTVKGREAAAKVRMGQVPQFHAIATDDVRMRVQRPNIFVLYEQNVGTLTPLIADQLRDIEKSYPPEWVAEAFDIAVAANKRALRYIAAILKRWETEGKDDGVEADRDTPENRRRKYLPDQTTDVTFG